MSSTTPSTPPSWTLAPMPTHGVWRDGISSGSCEFTLPMMNGQHLIVRAYFNAPPSTDGILHDYSRVDVLADFIGGGRIHQTKFGLILQTKDENLIAETISLRLQAAADGLPAFLLANEQAESRAFQPVLAVFMDAQLRSAFANLKLELAKTE